MRRGGYHLQRRDGQHQRRRGGTGHCYGEHSRAAATLAAVEHRSDTRRQIGTARHGQQRRFPGGRQAPREPYQLVGVGGRLGASQHRVVAGAFGFEFETPPRHPDQRVKPVHGARGPRQAVDQPVGAPHVFQLVHQRPMQILRFPGLCVHGQHDGGMRHAAGHRSRQRLLSSTSTRRRMPASSASPSTADCPCRHGSADRRRERTCHSPIPTGSRKSTAPAIQAASRRAEAGKSADGEAAGAVLTPACAGAADGIALTAADRRGPLLRRGSHRDADRRRDYGSNREHQQYAERRGKDRVAHRCPAPARQPGPHEAQRRGDGDFDQDRRGQRTAYREHHCIESRIESGHHDCFFLSLRTRSISDSSASSSSSVHDASDTREVIICLSEPPKKVCRCCCSAVRLATAGEVVAE